MSKHKLFGFLGLPNRLLGYVGAKSRLGSVANNSGWLFFEKTIRFGLNTVIAIWMARYLGPSEFGELAYTVAYIALFQAIANLGLDGIAVRDISTDKSRVNNILGTVFGLRMVVGLLSWLTAIAVVAFCNGWNDRSVQLTAIVGGVLVFQALDTIDLWFQSQSQSRRTVIVKAAAYSLSGGFKILMILSGAPLLMFAVAILIEAALIAFGLIWAYRKYPCKGRWKAIEILAIKLMRESWPFILSGISIMVYMRIDQIMIKEMIGVEELGVFAASIQFATFWQAIPVILATSLAPFVAKIKLRNEDAYWNAINSIFYVYAVLAWVIIIPTITFADLVIPFLYGEKYNQGALIVSIYVMTNLFVNMGVAQGLWMLNEGRSIIAFLNAFIGAIVSIFGNWLIIPHYGIVGVSAVAVLSMSCSAVLSNIFFSKKILLIQIRSILLIPPGLLNEKN